MAGQLFGTTVEKKRKTHEQPPKQRCTPPGQRERIRKWQQEHIDTHRKHVREAYMRWKGRNLDKARESNRECVANKRLKGYLEEALTSMENTGGLVMTTNRRLKALEASECWGQVVNYATEHTIDITVPKNVKAH